MCGYFGNLHESPIVLDLLNQLGIPLPYPQGQYYPRRFCDGLITSSSATSTGQAYEVKPAFWWYQVNVNQSRIIANEKITSFNARDLDKPLWRQAANNRRAIVCATELGESLGKERFLMRSKEGFVLGAIYKDWPDGTRSFAIITRPPHPRFKRYHDKSTPFFLPIEQSFIRNWLDPMIPLDHFSHKLENATLTCDLDITKVKTYKRGEALSSIERLQKDAAGIQE